MIHLNSFLNYIDTEQGSHGSITIDKLLTKYYHELDPMGNHSTGRFRFRRPSVYIKDWNGWTEILSIEKHEVTSEDKLYIIKVGNDDDYLILNDEAIVPVYDIGSINEPFIGFHGEIIYPHQLKSPKEITEKDYIRYYGDCILSRNGFINITIQEYKCPCDNLYMYNIETKSKYFNASNFYLF